MHYSRHEFLKVAAATLPALGAPWLYSDPAHAEEAEETRGGAYSQAQADKIHRQAMEQAIARAGK
jgi:hypothetical protein